jgi:NAD+ kinase
MPTVRELGVVVHPTRRLDRVLEEIDAWAATHGAKVGQVPGPGQIPVVAEPVQPQDCDLLLSLGGDGTTLIALHAAAVSSRPVLGVACGSVGALTSVTADRLRWALDQIAADDWTPVSLPGLEVSWGDAPAEVAINDFVVVRDGPGQVTVAISVDDVLYVRVAGDGVVVATALGSSAYTMAAGGPLLAPGAEGMVVTPLAVHGGACAPLVAGTDSHVTFVVDPGYGGVRYEVDGRRTGVEGSSLTVRRRPDYARLVALAEEEPRLTGLRRRGLVQDSPRVLVREARAVADRHDGARR